MPEPTASTVDWPAVMMYFLTATVPLIGGWIIVQLNKVHVAVNSNYSRLEQKFDVAIKRVDDLEARNKQQADTIAVLAGANATTAQVAVKANGGLREAVQHDLARPLGTAADPVQVVNAADNVLKVEEVKPDE